MRLRTLGLLLGLCGLLAVAQALAAGSDEVASPPLPGASEAGHGPFASAGSGTSSGDADDARSQRVACAGEVQLLLGRGHASLVRSWVEGAARGACWSEWALADWETARAESPEPSAIVVVPGGESLPAGLVDALSEQAGSPVFWLDASRPWESVSPRFHRMVLGGWDAVEGVASQAAQASSEGAVVLLVAAGGAWEGMLAPWLRAFEAGGGRVGGLHWWRGRPTEPPMVQRLQRSQSARLGALQQPWRNPPASASALSGEARAPSLVLVLAAGRERAALLDEVLAGLAEMRGARVLVMDEAWSERGAAGGRERVGVVALRQCLPDESLADGLEALGLPASWMDDPHALMLLDGLEAIDQLQRDTARERFRGWCGGRFLDGRVLRTRDAGFVELGADGRWAPLVEWGDGSR